MSVARQPSEDLLTRAFRGFERAATRLEERQGALRSEVSRLRRRLGDANRRLEAVLDAVESGVAVLSADGRVLRANRSFEKMRSATQPEAGDLGDLLGCGSYRGSATRLRTARGDRDLAVTVVPVGDEEETQVLTVQDVTEIRRQEEEGGRRQRLEALGRMAAELAHEVRNPLGGIRLFASMLHDDLGDRPELRKMAVQILQAGSSLEAIVSNLLAFASPSSAARCELDLAALTRDTCALLAPTCALRGVRLRGPGPDECRVRADPEGLRQVVLNLLGNALAATADNHGSIRVGVSREANCAVLHVADTGKGIAPEDLPRVFDPFFSRSEGGTGLGLSVVHRIIERHDGRISLDSGPGDGTRARVEIPGVVAEERE